MTVEEIIDSALSLGDNVPSTDAAYIERRRRAKALLQEVFNDAFWARDWPRRKTDATVTVLANAGQCQVPADFGSIGEYGGLYLMQGGIARIPPLEWRPEHEITDSRLSGEVTDSPTIFSIFDFEETTPGSGIFRDLFQFPKNSVQLTIQAHYQRRPPVLLDAGDPDETPGATLTAGNQATAYIGEQFHENVLVNGLKSKLRESKGDARWQYLAGQYGLGVAAMKKESNRFKSADRRLPSFFGGWFR